MNHRLLRLNGFAILAGCLLLFGFPVGWSQPLHAQQVENVGSQEDLAKQRKTKELQDEIRNLFSEGRFETAIDKAEELLLLNPGDATATLLRERAQRYLASGMAPPTPVAPAQILPTPTPIPTAESGTDSGAEAPVAGTSQPAETHTPAASSSSSRSDGGMLGMILKVVGALVGVALIAGLILWLKSRKLSLPKVAPVRSLAAGNYTASASPLGMMGGLSSVAPVTQPGYFMDVEPDPATLPTQQATVYDENTNVEAMGAKDKSQRIPMMNEQDRLAIADLPTAPGNIGASGDLVVDGIDGVEDEGETVAFQKASAPAAPDISGLKLDAPRGKSEPPAPKPVAPDPVTIPEMAPRPAPPAPKPQPKAPPMDIAAMLPPLEEEQAPKAPAASAGLGLDIAPPSLFAPADQTASVDPAALSFNSLMFGSESTQDKAPAAPAASTEDLTLNSFNQEYSSVMFGTGTEETNMPAVTGAPAASAPKTPAADESQAKTLAIAPVTLKAAPHDGGETISLAPASGTGDMADAETIAPVPAAPNTKITMFERQRDAGKAAYEAGDFAKAVHCLSIAASLKPSDKEIRALLDEARQKRRG